MLPEGQPQDFAGMEISRRRFMAVSGVGAALLARPPLIAAEDGIVPTMVNAAAKARIATRTLRRNISLLEGSGGNIAVLSGLLSDRFATDRRQWRPCGRYNTRTRLSAAAVEGWNYIFSGRGPGRPDRQTVQHRLRNSVE